MTTRKEISAHTLKPYILVTLSHTERREKMEPKRIAEIFKQLFRCKSIVIARETHKELGEHLHIAIYNDNASRYNAAKRIRQAFPQFEGRQCNVTFHKGLNFMLGYATKEDKDPYVEGEIDKKQVLQIAENARKKKKAGRKPAKEILQALRQCQKWEDVYDNHELSERIVYGSHRNFKTIYQELQIIRESKTDTTSRIRTYLNERKVEIRGVTEYTPEQLQEKYVLLDWIAVNIVYQRPMKTKQLLLYGEPSTQKSLVMQILKKALRIYFVGTRINDFSGADDHYDMWVFDEYSSNERIGNMGKVDYSEAASAYNRTILRILDGQECRLDAKYSETFRKTRNVPIILIANQIPQEAQRYGPLQERLLRLRFHTRITHIEDERLILTLMGCIRRRIYQKAQWEELEHRYLLLYNEEHAKCTKIRHQRRQLFLLKNEQERECVLLLNAEEETAILFVDPESFENTIMTTLKYALIPLEIETHAETTTTKIDALKRGAKFHILREPEYEGMKQYLTWPVNLRFSRTDQIISAHVRIAPVQKEAMELFQEEIQEEQVYDHVIIRIGAENGDTFDSSTRTPVWMHHD